MDSQSNFTKLSTETNGQELWSFDSQNENPPNQATCSRVLEFLFVGGYLAAENVAWLKEMKITCVINVRKALINNIADDIEYVNVDVDDDEYEPIHWYFDDTTTKIENHRNANGKILINCEMGISRSATICLMYLVRCQNRTLRQAYYELKRLRPCIHPNTYFWRAMILYEKKWLPANRKTSVKLMDVGLPRAIPDVYM